MPTHRSESSRTPRDSSGPAFVAARNRSESAQSAVTSSARTAQAATGREALHPEREGGSTAGLLPERRQGATPSACPGECAPPPSIAWGERGALPGAVPKELTTANRKKVARGVGGPSGRHSAPQSAATDVQHASPRRGNGGEPEGGNVKSQRWNQCRTWKFVQWSEMLRAVQARCRSLPPRPTYPQMAKACGLGDLDTRAAALALAARFPHVAEATKQRCGFDNPFGEPQHNGQRQHEN